MNSLEIGFREINSVNALQTRRSTYNIGPIVTLNKENIRISEGVMVLGIGRRDTNAIQIGANCKTEELLEASRLRGISRNHAEMAVDTKTGIITLKDNNSSYGTGVIARHGSNTYENLNPTYLFDAAQHYSYLPRENGIPVASGRNIRSSRSDYFLDLKDKWEIVLAVGGQSAKYSDDSLVIKSDGTGKLTFHQIDSNTSQPGEAVSELSIPLPDDTSPEVTRAATNANRLRLGLN